MDTSIYLLSRKRQLDFFDDIFERRLMEVFKTRVGVVLHALQMVLGDDYLKGNGQYHVNSDIASIFLAMLLGGGESKKMVEAIMVKLMWAQWCEGRGISNELS
ncbi:hypothetical protein SUGI_0117300 [Cryptomeria japonica]|nr:hypothetical protein SUGI_0117300 [Cryptomeria japonica]